MRLITIAVLLLTLSGCSLISDEKAEKIHKQWEPVIDEAGEKFRENTRKLLQELGDDLLEKLEGRTLKIEITLEEKEEPEA